MHSNLIFLFPFFGGMILGVFIKPTILLAIAFGLWVACIIGLILSGLFSDTNLTWMFGIGGMALPFYATPAIVGSCISWGLLQLLIKIRGE